MLAFLLQGMALGLSAAWLPGPFKAFLFSYTSIYGWRRTIWAAFAPLLSDGFIIAVALLIINSVPPSLTTALHVAGGFFLLYLAHTAYQALQAETEAHTEAGGSLRDVLTKATITNLLNPNPYIFWSFVGGPIIRRGWATSHWYAVSFLVGMYLFLVGGMAGLVLLFGLTGRFDATLRRRLALVSVVLLVSMAGWQFWMAWQAWNG
nr:LysE family transporter [Ardenticatena sp.]